MARRSLPLLIGTAFLAACSRGGGARTKGADAAPTPAAGAVSAVASPEAGAAAPLVTPGKEASAPAEIALPGAPSLTVRAVGPSLIEVTLTRGGPTTWTTIEVERHVVSAEPRQRDKFARTGPLSGPRRSHSAKPGTTYVYRARTGKAWSPEVTVRTAEPGGAPPAPTGVTTEVMTPLAVRVSWQADHRMAAGFEIEVGTDGEYRRAALVDPSLHSFEHHLRLPNRTDSYRVRAFNARGVSEPSAVATVSTGDRAVPLTHPLPPCTKLPPEKPAPTNGMPRMVVNEGSDHRLYNIPEGPNGLRRHLFGEYQGCFRDFGVFSLQADVSEVDGFADEGFPLLHAIAGAGEFAGAQILTLRFAGGRYTVADEAFFCGAPYPEPDPADPAVSTEGADDLTAYAPPFAACQRDFQR